MARRGDTKLLCHVAQMIIALSGVSLWPLSGGKSLVLCQEERAKVSQAPMRHAWSNRASPGACGAVLASPACRAVPARQGGHAALWEPGSGPRRVPSRGGVLSDAGAMRCVRMPAALNRTHHDPYLTGTRPGGAQRTCLLSCGATSPVLLWA